jgi:hypothetical protein
MRRSRHSSTSPAKPTKRSGKAEVSRSQPIQAEPSRSSQSDDVWHVLAKSLGRLIGEYLFLQHMKSMTAGEDITPSSPATSLPGCKAQKALGKRDGKTTAKRQDHRVSSHRTARGQLRAA